MIAYVYHLPVDSYRLSNAVKLGDFLSTFTVQILFKNSADLVLCNKHDLFLQFEGNNSNISKISTVRALTLKSA